MPVGAASWSFTEDDFGAITGSLQRFLYGSNAKCALLVDRAGQLVATVGEPLHFDPTAFATLTTSNPYDLLVAGDTVTGSTAGAGAGWTSRVITSATVAMAGA